MTLYHITSKAEADAAVKAGEYVPAAFSIEGFIHCSHIHQLSRVARARFSGRNDLVLFEIDGSKLMSKVVEENLEGGEELFPHIYGRLPMSAVVHMHEFTCAPDGSFCFYVERNHKHSIG